MTVTIRRLLLASCAVPLLSSVVHAADVAPSFIDTFPVVPAGIVAGHEAYRIPGDDILWIRLADGSMVAGWVYGSDGSDLSATVTGTDPMDAWETVGISRPSGQATEPLPASTIVEPVTAPVTAPEPELPDGVAPEDAAVISSSQEAANLVNEALGLASSTLATIPEDRKQALLLELIEVMDAATSQADFRLKVVEWNEKVQGKSLISDADRKLLQDAAKNAVSVQEGSLALPAPASPTAVAASPAPEPGAPSLPREAVTPPLELRAPATDTLDMTSPLPGEPDLWVEPEAPALGTSAITTGAGLTDADIFMDEILTRTSWIEIGKPSAPAVYMFADPLCPYCAKAFANLKTDVEAGDLRLRVILAPLISQNTPKTIAAILMAQNPAQALWEHEQSYALYGSSDLPPADPQDLTPEQRAAIQGNYDLLAERKIPGVPFFAWDGASGPAFLSGVPQTGHFARTGISN